MTTQYCTQCGKPLKPHVRFCSQCGVQIQGFTSLSPGPSENDNAEKNSQRIQNSKPETRNSSALTKKVIIGLFVAVIGILLLLVFQFITYEEHSVIARQPVISEPVYYTGEPLGMTEIQSEQRDGYFILSLDEIKQNKFVRAWYDAQTTQLPVIAYISPKGRLITAIGITEPCGESDYTIVENHIHCSNCTGEWDLNSMVPFGSCSKYYPSPIPSIVDRDDVIISLSDLNAWNRRW